MTTKERKQTIRVAVPYYGALIRPNVGLEKVYFVADVDLKSSSLKSLSVKVWNPKVKRGLPEWIKKGGISGIICTDSTPCLDEYIDDKDIWVHWGQVGDVRELIEQWALSQHPFVRKNITMEVTNVEEEELF